ncbi:MAG: hypothetical protein GYA51_07120 [Candidatus Methanofastidiosa archaeon]|nr:hypothetical protein [Candidatus Methanofastidiosa archaeon]
MGKFYLSYQLPTVLNEIINLLIKRFLEDGTMTFNFYYSSPGGGGKTLDIGAKSFNQLQDKPIESLEKLGFGKIEYTMTGGKWPEKKDQGLFTISKEMLDYSFFISKPTWKRNKDKIIEGIKENEIPISVFISLAALIISILSIFLGGQ